MRIVFASNNGHKLSEVREIMPKGIEILSLRDIGFDQEIDETGVTLAENSMLKARTVWDWLAVNEPHLPIDGVFADDTGLEIDAFGGEPGVYTARWYRKDAEKISEDQFNDEMKIFAANRAKALRELEGVKDRGCQFKTVITLIRRNGITQVDGIVRGVITTQEHGTSGFGYDPIFKPEGYDKTFGELPTDIKNTISHRARALAKLVNVID